MWLRSLDISMIISYYFYSINLLTTMRTEFGFFPQVPSNITEQVSPLNWHFEMAQTLKSGREFQTQLDDLNTQGLVDFRLRSTVIPFYKSQGYQVDSLTIGTNFNDKGELDLSIEAELNTGLDGGGMILSTNIRMVNNPDGRLSTQTLPRLGRENYLQRQIGFGEIVAQSLNDPINAFSQVAGVGIGDPNIKPLVKTAKLEGGRLNLVLINGINQATIS